MECRADRERKEVTLMAGRGGEVAAPMAGDLMELALELGG